MIWKVGVKSPVRSSSFSVPVSLASARSMLRVVSDGSVGSVSIVTLRIPLVPDEFPAESFATAVSW